MRYLLAGAIVALTLAGCAQVGEPPRPSDAELDAYIREQQDLQWLQYGSLQMQRPEVDAPLVSPSNHSNVAGCEMGGASAVVSSGGGILESTESVSETAQYECQAALIPYPTVIDYYTTEQLGFIYDYYRDALVPCLQGQGLDVGFAPSRADFASVAGFVPWDPYTELGADLPPKRAKQIVAQCPPLPHADFLEPE